MYSQLSVIGWFEVFPFPQMLFSIQCPTSPQHLQPSYKEKKKCHMPPAHLGETSVFRLGGRGGEEEVRAYQLFGSLVVLNEV